MNRITLAILAALLLSTAVLGAAAKHYYDKDVLADSQIDRIEQEHALAVSDMKEQLSFSQKRYDDLSRALEQQRKSYASAKRETSRLREKINELKAASPEVDSYLSTPMPDQLYERMFPQDTDH